MALSPKAGLAGVGHASLNPRHGSGKGATPNSKEASLAILLLAGVAGALAVVSSALPLVGRLTDLEETRFE